MFNAIRYANQLEEAGFSRRQAEIQLQAISEIVEGDLTTKQDLKNLENRIEIKLNNLENKIQQVEYRITIKLGSLLIVGFTSMIAAMKFLNVH